MNTCPERTVRVLRGPGVGVVSALHFPVVEPVAAVAGTVAPPVDLAAERAAAREQARDEGYAAGLAEGYAAGRDQGVAEARLAFSALLEHLDAECARFAAREERAFAELADAAGEVAFALVEELLGRELALADSPGRDALARALRAAPDAGSLTARFHPADLDALGDLDDLVAGRAVAVVADPAVGPGGCVLEVGDARVDARLSAALDRVRAELVGTSREPAGQPR